MAQLRVFCSFFAFTLACLTATASVAATAEAIDLSPKIKPHDVVRVTVELEAGGFDLVRDNTSLKPAEGEVRKLSMSVVAKLTYDERRLPKIAGNTPASRLLAVRHYTGAAATLKVEDTGVAPRLAGDRRLIVVEKSDNRPILAAPAGPLSRQELDLIDVIGNSYAIDELLPATAVRDGDTWNQDKPVMTALLALDSIAVCEVQSVLEEFNGHFAKVRLAGVVHGTVDGAATQHEVRGVYLFDRRLGRITRLNLAVKENRSIGAATPGLDGVAKLQMTIEPVASSPELSDQTIDSIAATLRVAGARANNTARIHKLLLEAPNLGFRLDHDRRWFVTAQQRESIMLRRVDSTGLVAQCTLTTLPPKSAGRQTTLDEFQKDIRLALGKSFGQLVSSRQWMSRAGNYCYEVVVRGTVEEVPVEFHHYLVAGHSGHRVSLAFTIEGPMVQRLAGADRELVESLQLIPITRQSAQTAAKPAAPSSR